jgi:uncharacterized protein YbaP (TraB family)
MKRFFAAVSFCVIHFFVHAQPALQNTLLWQITGPGITMPSYLYGTIHLMCANEIKVSDTLRAKFYSTQKLFLEVNLDDPSVMVKTMQQMQMRNDTTLAQLLSAPQYDSLAVQFKKLTGMSLSMMNRMKPELAESLIYPSLLGCESTAAWEQKFTQLAKANNMEINGLEDVEDQLKIFDEIPYADQAKELAETLNNIDSTKQNFNQLLSLYKQKNLNALTKMLNQKDGLTQYDDLLLNNRNKKWIPEIIQQAKLQPTFFAVGAGHLGNENGLINLLKQAGYTVLPVNY